MLYSLITAESSQRDSTFCWSNHACRTRLFSARFPFFSNGTSAADQHLQGACVPMYQAPYHMLVVSHVLGSWPGQLMLRNVLFTRLFPFSLLDVPRYLPYSYKAHAHAFIDKQRCTCAMKYDRIQHNTAWYNAIHYNTNALHYNPTQYNSNTTQYNSNTTQ